MATKDKNTITKAELAEAYGVDRRTLYNWLLPHKERFEQAGISLNTRIFTPKAVEIIYDILGKP